MTSATRARHSWINIRGIAILCVILIHVTSSGLGNHMGAESNLQLLLNQVSRFGVPVFLISSGYGLALKQKESSNFRYFVFLHSRAKILPPYIFWTAVYVSLRVLTGSLSISASDILKSFLFGQSEYHMYFIVVLISSYLLFPVLFFLCRQLRGLLFVLCLTLAFQILALIQVLPLGDGAFVGYWLIYPALGIYFATHPESLSWIKRFSIIVFGVGLFILLLSAFNSVSFGLSTSLATTAMRPSVIVYTVGILGVFLRFAETPNRLLALFDGNSMQIYYFHPLVLIVLTVIFSRVFGNSLIFVQVILKSFVVAMASLIFSIVVNKVFRSRKTIEKK